MSDIRLNALAASVRDALIESHPDWATYADVIGEGDLELAVPAPSGSRAGHLVVFTNQGTEIWIRYARPNMCCAVESLDEMHAVIRALLADDAFFVVVTQGDEWVETSVLRPGEEPVVVEGQVANIVSWCGLHDKIVTFVGDARSRSEGGA